nr:3-oxoacyl-ACP reductase family protein [Calditrichia bacterium]
MMLQDKICLVTGASRGIGREISRLLAGNGAQVILNYNSSATAAQKLADEIIAEGGKATTVKADVSSREEVDEMFKFIRKEFKRLDVLVNNAGILRDNLMLMTPDSDYDAIMDVNLKGAFMAGQAVARQMGKQIEAGGKPGTIINMSSVNAVFALPNQVPYSISKGGMNQLTKVMALSLAPHGIRVNAIGPGSIMTEMFEQVVWSDQAARTKVLSRTPAGRIGDPSEIAAVAAFL